MCFSFLKLTFSEYIYFILWALVIWFLICFLLVLKPRANLSDYNKLNFCLQAKRSSLTTQIQWGWRYVSDKDPLEFREGLDYGRKIAEGKQNFLFEPSKASRIEAVGKAAGQSQGDERKQEQSTRGCRLWQCVGGSGDGVGGMSGRCNEGLWRQRYLTPIIRGIKKPHWDAGFSFAWVVCVWKI